ncbi:MAG TPA: YdeI/OmpD-associated family protein [Bacteroidia bacterium]|jgi:uncharacterized protein YdeI (YjbR/CyaY-like superfamily)|nr:YdeI/OmpD-associated family protein [Bacteroidia bacterium]
MPKKDPRIDAYITKAKPFAQPILKHLRKLMHQACPQVEETIKWSFASFDYKGPFASMASFNEHCAFGFWKAALMEDSKNLKENQQTAMGHLGRITSMKDLPSDKKIIAYIKEAMELNDKGIKLPARKKETNPKPLPVPPYFKTALSKNKKAKEQFENFAPGQKKEYILWLTEAKTEETRNRRMEQAIEWIGEGKIRNWKYLNK